MRKQVSTMLLVFLLVCFAAIPVFAAEVDVTAKYISDQREDYITDVSDDIVFITLPDGTEVSVDNIPGGVVSLVTYPIPASEKEAWTWITSCFNGIGNPIYAFGIYFLDANGNDVDANGVVVTVDCPHCSSKPMVYSLTTNGDIKPLTQNTRSISVAFTTNGSLYYVLVEKFTESDENTDGDTADDNNSADSDSDSSNEKPTTDDSVPDRDNENSNNVEVKDNGNNNSDKPSESDVEISDTNPDTGDTVTITPKPDEGKVVDEVIVTDENGNEVEVEDNGDGSYSYEQPDGDVTVDVTFKDGDTDVPQSDKDSYLWLWVGITIIAAATAGGFLFILKKRKSKQN